MDRSEKRMEILLTEREAVLTAQAVGREMVGKTGAALLILASVHAQLLEHIEAFREHHDAEDAKQKG